ncbi:hypothetical protein M422DRAFT_45701 [Sphaerobolus stellatus SS14]|nr:hypothetical protein M422DRAFT_45701 [Sphaerobolus stellatus SS14]
MDIPIIPDFDLPIPDASGIDSVPDTDTGGIDTDPDTTTPNDHGGASLSPPKSKYREPGTLHPLTVGTKKSLRHSALGVYIAFTILSAHQLIAALMKLCGRRQRKGFQRTTKFRVLMVLTTLTLLAVNALGIVYTALNGNLDPPENINLQNPDIVPIDQFQGQTISILKIQTVDDFLATVAEWLVIVSALTLVYNYLVYKSQEGEELGRDSLKNAWEEYRTWVIVLYVGATALVIAGAVQLGIFMVAIQNGEGLFPNSDAQGKTREVVTWTFAICIAIIILILQQVCSQIKRHGTLIPELVMIHFISFNTFFANIGLQEVAGTKYAVLFLLLAAFFIVDAIFISANIYQNIMKLVEITVAGGLMCGIVWSLLWEHEIKPPMKAG